MADSLGTSVHLRRVFTNNEVEGNEIKCEMCKDYESHLKEVLEELNSIIMINKLLQKDLSSYTLSKSVREDNLDISEYTSSTRDNTVNNWTRIVTKTKKDKSHSHKMNGLQGTNNYIETINRFSPLTKLIDLGDPIPVIINGSCTSTNNYKTKASAQVKSYASKIRNNISSTCTGRKSKILILGDSHSRSIASELQQFVDKDSKTQALIKPVANIAAILCQKDLIIAKMDKHDVCIIWGGTQDISRRESEQGIQQLIELIDKHQNTNIIFVEVPHRYDLMPDSRVNDEIKTFNKKLKSLSDQYVNLSVIEISKNREVYIRHGLHMNRKGKEQTARKIATEFGKIMKRNKMKLVVPPCKLKGSREEVLVGEVKVISGTEDTKANQPGTTTASPSNQESPNEPSSASLSVHLGNPEEQWSESTINVNVLSVSDKCCDASIIVGASNIQELEGQTEIIAGKAKPIINLSLNNLEKPKIDGADVGSILNKPNKSNEELNKISCNLEWRVKNTKSTTPSEVVSNLGCNHSINERNLVVSPDTDKDTPALHKEIRNIRISNRKKQIPLTRNDDFLWE